MKYPCVKRYSTLVVLFTAEKKGVVLEENHHHSKGEELGDWSEEYFTLYPEYFDKTCITVGSKEEWDFVQKVLLNTGLRWIGSSDLERRYQITEGGFLHFICKDNFISLDYSTQHVYYDKTYTPITLPQKGVPVEKETPSTQFKVGDEVLYFDEKVTLVLDTPDSAGMIVVKDSNGEYVFTNYEEISHVTVENYLHNMLGDSEKVEELLEKFHISLK